MKGRMSNLQKVATTTVAATCLVFSLVMTTAQAAALPRFCAVRSAKSVLRIATSADRKVPRAGVHLLVNRAEVSPSSVVYARLVNLGAEVVSYGREFRIEELGADGWRLDPASPTGPWVRVRGLIRPGFAGRCFSFEVPPDETAGQHRFVTHVEVGPNGRRSSRRASFSVDGSP